MSTNTQKVVKGISSQTAITIVLGVVEIILFSLMSRFLSQKDFGYYAAIVAVATVFQSLTETGIGASLVQKKELNQKYINNAFSLCLVFGIIISGTFFVIAGILARLVADETMTNPLRLFSITLICSCLSSVNISLMQRKLQFLKIGLINLFALIFSAIIAVWLAIKGLGYYAILIKVILQSVIVFFISYIVAKPNFSFEFDKNEYKKIFNFGGWLMFSAVFRNIANQVDRFLMTSFFSIETLGFYSRPKEFITQIAEKFNSIFDSVLFPILSTIQDEEERLRKTFLSTIYSLNLFGMLISVTFLCNSELLIRVFFGDEWLNTNLLFMVLSIYPLLLINGRLGDIFLRALALTRQQFYFRVGQFLLSILLIFLAYRYGIIVVAITILLAYLTITLIKMFFLAKKIGIHYYIMFFTVLKSYKFCCVTIPIVLICNLCLPHSWIGNIIMAVIFTFSTVILFTITPKLVGETYKSEIYKKVMSFIYLKIRKF